MSLSAQTTVKQPLNGTVVLAQDEVVSIARESDFIDLLDYTPPETQFRVMDALKKLCASFGESRTPAMDLYRQRLSQLRRHLRAA